jgi:aspartate carbamoyltransferase catalytic subunit
MRSFLGLDILSLKDFERSDYFRLFEVTRHLAPVARNRRNIDLLKEKTLVTAFYQPSTRTRLSHEAAMHRLGGHVLGFSDAKMTRAGDWYQESIKDTARMLELYGDVIVMRHFQKGAPAETAKWASVPVINAGDGWGEHPTQVLGDLFCIQEDKGRIDGLKFLCIGDMRMRTMHSLSYALTQFDAEVTYVAPEGMTLTPEFKQELDARNLRYHEAEHIAQAVQDADVIYVESVVAPDYTQSRVDNSAGQGLTPEAFRVTPDLLRKAKSDVMVLHSLPRVDEIPVEVDFTRHARYWEEAFSCLVVRMALLALILGAIEQA